MNKATMGALDKALPRTIHLKPFVFYEVQRFPAVTIERVVSDGMFALLCGTSDDIEVRFRAKIAATEPEHVYREWPRTWWDAFKRRWFPRWALRRWPALIDSVNVTKVGLYPEIPWRDPSGSVIQLTAIPYLDAADRGYLDRGPEEDD